jgi:hypothetical protein
MELDYQFLLPKGLIDFFRWKNGWSGRTMGGGYGFRIYSMDEVLSYNRLEDYRIRGIFKIGFIGRAEIRVQRNGPSSFLYVLARNNSTSSVGMHFDELLKLLNNPDIFNASADSFNGLLS